MSFVCQVCSEVQPVSSKPNRVVVEWYDPKYRYNGNGEVISSEQQIKKEKDLCDYCFAEFMIESGQVS